VLEHISLVDSINVLNYVLSMYFNAILFISPCRRHRGTIAIDKSLTTY
jgi:hypothetical protein